MFANTVNNAISSHLHQRFGAIDSSLGLAGYHCMDDIGWRVPRFAEHAHRSFLRSYEDGLSERFIFPDWVLFYFERYSINCFSFFGSDFSSFGGRVGQDEEQWLSVEYPREKGRMNVICGNAVVAHFAFHTQREYLDRTDLLHRYTAIRSTETHRAGSSRPPRPPITTT